LTRASAVVGTTGYVAPETRDGADPHPAGDLFAAGMSTAEMLTGVRPDDSTDVVALLDEFDVPSALGDLVCDLVATDPRDRPDALTASERLDAGRPEWSGPEGADPEEPIEIFDHVSQLPEPWTEAGPAPGGVPEREPTPAEPRERPRGWLGPTVQIAAGAILILVAVIFAPR